MKALVLGGTGMLGHKVFQTLKQRIPDTFCTIRNFKHEDRLAGISLLQSENVIDGVDAEDFPALKKTLDELRPDVIVNCVGIIKQRKHTEEAASSIALNALLPHWLAYRCDKWGGRLIHISTDCVFSGKVGGYTEDDPSDAEDLYGKTKSLGEVRAGNCVTLRTSIIGRELFHYKSLLEWFLSQERKQVKGFRRAFYSGVTTNHLAEVIADVILLHPRLSGIYQVTSQTISKYELLLLLRDAYKLDVEITPDETFHCDRSMRGDRFRLATGYICRPWPELVAQLANDTTPYGNWRFKKEDEAIRR